jgi:hypothetical protein
MMRKQLSGKIGLGLILGLLTAIVCWGTGAAPQVSAQEKNSGPAMEVTVYNQDLALVKERRMMDLPAGAGAIRFAEVAALIDPSSVKFKTPGAPGVRVLEQNYEYDVVSDVKLLQKYLGAKIKITDTGGVTLEGYLAGAGENLIIAAQPSGGEVKILKSAQIQTISLPEMPDGLVTKPTLVWLLQNPGKAGRYPVEVSYLTGGLSWKADYVATINGTDDRIDLTGWVTLNNQSGGDYPIARLKLVAGDVNRASEASRYGGAKKFLYEATAANAPDPSFEEKSFFEYHLYTLSRPTTLKNFQIKQVELLSAGSVPARKLFVYEGAADLKKVKVMLEVKNGKEENLGMPLPQGRIRVQKADHEGSLQFIGEDRIDHTPEGEKLRIYLGNAFDIVGERARTEVKETTERTREESYRIKIRNHKNENVTVTVIENLSGWHEWKIVKSDQKYTKTEAGKAEFNIAVPPDGEKTVNYTVRYKR